ncbi:MAG: carboxypeptidase regulatory-like domain-containing protein [Acidobacteria bacterium]|nr:carboxypeptidase regulatory-like domain-containing protein [Acidobacteriota bacterium]
MSPRFPLLCLCAVAIVSAQSTATLFGTVHDSANAVIPGAAVTATHVETGTVRTAAADAKGDFVFVQLPVGTFAVRASAPGFKESIQTGLLLQVSENRRVDFALQVGQVNERIEVEAQAVQVETRTGTIGEVIDSKRIAELPLNGRNPVSLQLLVPGVGRRGGRDQQQNETVSVNGSAFRGNNYALDGGDNHDPFFNTPAPFPNPDALQEFSIETNGYGADKGRNAGVFVSAVTKSGTNAFHGSAFEYRKEIGTGALLANGFSLTAEVLFRVRLKVRQRSELLVRGAGDSGLVFLAKAALEIFMDDDASKRDQPLLELQARQRGQSSLGIVSYSVEIDRPGLNIELPIHFQIVSIRDGDGAGMRRVPA